MNSFVIFRTLLVSASIPIGLGYFIPSFKRKIGGGKGIYMRDWFLGESLTASEVNVSSGKAQNDCSKLPSVNIARTVFLKENLQQRMKKIVLCICWFSKTFVYTMAVAVYPSAKLKETSVFRYQL